MGVWMWFAVAQVVLLSEGFESGTLPAGWTIGNGGDGTTWTVDLTSGYFPVPPNSGSYAVFVNLSVPQDDTLQAPAVGNDPGLSGHRLVYDYAYWGEASPSGETLAVLVRTAVGGSWGTWSTVHQVEVTGLTVASETLALTVSGADSIQVAFRVWGDTNSLHLSVDNVQILADSLLAADVALRAILSPVEGQYVGVGTPVPVEVSVENLSAQAQSFSVTFTIREAATSTVVYQETQSVTSLPAGDTARVVFPDFTPALRVDFVGEAVVVLTGDQNPANDTQRVSFTAVPYLGAELGRWVLPDTTFIRVSAPRDGDVYLVRNLSADTSEVGVLDPGTQVFTSLFRVPRQGILSGFAVEGSRVALAWLNLATGETVLELWDTQGNRLAQHLDARAVVALEDAPEFRGFYAVVDPNLSLTEPNPLFVVEILDSGLVWTPVGDTTLPTNFLQAASLYRYTTQTPWLAYVDFLFPSVLFVEHGGVRDSVDLGVTVGDVAILRVDLTTVSPDSVFAAYVIQEDTLRLLSLGTFWALEVSEKPTRPAGWTVWVEGGRIRAAGLPAGSRYVLMDLLGRRVRQGEVRGQVLDVVPPSRGLYFLRVEIPGVPGTVKRIIVP